MRMTKPQTKTPSTFALGVFEVWVVGRAGFEPATNGLKVILFSSWPVDKSIQTNDLLVTGNTNTTSIDTKHAYTGAYMDILKKLKG
jgi:hypothetical protein